jgi:hypothetical protein
MKYDTYSEYDPRHAALAELPCRTQPKLHSNRFALKGYTALNLFGMDIPASAWTSMWFTPNTAQSERM